MPTKFRSLHCENGDHTWDAPIKRGRPPRNCPAHPPVRDAPAEKSQEAMSKAIERVMEERSCFCDIRSDMTREEIQALGSGCGGPWYVCSTLDAVRRAIQ